MTGRVRSPLTQHTSSGPIARVERLDTLPVGRAGASCDQEVMPLYWSQV